MGKPIYYRKKLLSFSFKTRYDYFYNFSFLNNTAVVASFMSMVKNNQFHAPSKLLIPLSYFAIAGGVTTLIGTSTNLIIDSFVVQNGLPNLKIFDFCP